MTLKPRIRVFGTIIAASLIFRLAVTGYFGWNLNPQTHAEVICDQIVNAMFFSAGLAFAVPGLSFLCAINPFRRVTWFYIERDRDGSEVVSAHRITRLGNALLLAGVLWLLNKLIHASGAPVRLSRFQIVNRVVEGKDESSHA